MTVLTLAEELDACTQRCREMDGPLAARLSAMADDVRRLAPDFANIVDRMVDRLRNGGAGATAPGIGETVPPFVLPDDNGHLVSLESLLEKGTLVIAFHRGHWCPYCRIGAGALAQIEPALRERGASLVIITPETQRFNRALKADSGATCPFLSDLDCGYALELNLAIKINDEKRSAMTSAGWDIAKYQNNENWILPIPATYIVGRDGVILGRFVDPDYRRRMEVDDLLRAVDTPTRGVSSQG
ncbi:MAG: peroxiredoxin-like family protein [Paracoccaceae bacterium]